MKLLYTILSLLSIGSLVAQEAKIKTNAPEQDMVYVISLDNKSIEIASADGVLNDLGPEWIHNISVLKGNSVPLHIRNTNKDVKGVIYIDLKNVKEARAFFEALQTNLEVVLIKENDKSVLSVKKVDSSRDGKIRITRNEELDILVRLNHEGTLYKMDFSTFQDINPIDIDGISVIKDKETLIENNADDKEGIIDVKLKENERTKRLIAKVIENQKNKDQN